MRVFNLAFCLIVSLFAVGTVRAEPQWLTLPPTPVLPKAEESGLAAVNGIKIWYATFNCATGANSSLPVNEVAIDVPSGPPPPSPVLSESGLAIA